MFLREEIRYERRLERMLGAVWQSWGSHVPVILKATDASRQDNRTQFVERHRQQHARAL